MGYRILHTEWSDNWGGQEIRIFSEGRAMTDRGHEVTLLIRPGGEMAARVHETGLPFIEMFLKNAFDPVSLWRLARLFRQERYDVVHTHSSVDSWLASAAAKIVGIPILVRTRHLSLPVATHPFNFVYQWPDGIVTTGRSIRDRLIQVNGTEPERVVSIPTGIDLSIFDPGLDPGSVREDLGLPPGCRVVTMVAVLRHWKRHDIFLEAAARLSQDRPDLRFLIVGDGYARQEIEDKIRELGLEDRVIMTGHRTDVPRILAATDVGVLTSDSAEGVPQSLLQCQAMARPVVGTSAGGIPEVVIHGQTGLLCPVNDSEAVAEAVARILDQEDLARTLARNGRRQVEECHSLEAMAQATEAFYDRLFLLKKGAGKKDKTGVKTGSGKKVGYGPLP